MKVILLVSLLLRCGFLVYGEWQDAHMAVPYTDIDYAIFTDAAALVANNSSPYLRETYRYTPLLAILLLPTTRFFQFGKLLFVFADLLTGFLILKILIFRNVKNPSYYSAIWLLNPMVMTISTRGSSESLLTSLVLLFVYLLLKGWLRLASVVFGLAVHFKIYPIIYAVSVLMWLGEDGDGRKTMVVKKKNSQSFMVRIPSSSSSSSSKTKKRRNQIFTNLMTFFINRQKIEFFLFSASTFLALTYAMYYVYGFEFLNETYLYHLVRKDHRHNFSVYFYQIYLTYSNDDDGGAGGVLKFLLFLPQLALVFGLGVKFGKKDLGFALFVQTFAFVMLNKVCTSQYFLWYVCFLPIVLPFTRLSGDKSWLGVILLVCWAASQGLWLYFAYNLEFLAINTFRELWVSGLLFYLVNVAILSLFCQNHIFEKEKIE